MSYGGAVVIAAAALTSRLGATDWFRGYNDPLNSVLTGSVFIAPLICGVVGLRCQQLVRAGVLQLSASSPRGRRGAIEHLALAAGLWTVAALALATIIALARGILVAFDWISVVFLLLALLNTTAAVAIGLAVGSRTEAPFAPVLTALGVFGWPYVLAYSLTWVGRLSFIYNTVSYPAELEPRLSVMSVQLGIDAVIAVACGYFAGSRRALRSRQMVFPALGTLVGLAAGVAAIAALGANPVVLRSTPKDPPCVPRAGVQICLWPQDAAYLSAVATAVNMLRTDLNGIYPIPVRFAEPGLTSRSEAGYGILIAPVHPLDENVFVSAVADSLVPAGDCARLTAANADAEGQLRFFIAILDGEVERAPTKGPVAAVVGSSRRSERAWVQSEMELARKCS
jgi:hypothetical protein